MNRKVLEGFLIVALILACASPCFGGMASENYRILRSVHSGGGAFMVSENYAALSTLGQGSGVGSSSSGAFAVHAGFWIPILADGDLNGDGKIDLTDLVLSLQVLAGGSPPGVLRGADVNGDGCIGLAEAIYILGKAAGLRE